MVLINKRFIWSHTASGVDAGTAPLRGGVHALGSGSGGSWTLNSGIYYIYDGKRVIQERDTNNSPTVSYTRGNDLSGTLAGAGGIGGLLARTDGTGSTFYHADGNGNITYLETSAQGLGAKYRYDPFGNVTSSSGTYATANTYRFSSKEWVPSVNGYYYLYRFYVPGIERWLNRDTLEEVGFKLIQSITQLRQNNLSFQQENNYNLYVFTLNSPNTYIDPNGQSIQSLCDLWYVTPQWIQARDSYLNAIARLNQKYGEGNWPDNVQSYMNQWLNELQNKFGPDVVAPIVNSVPGTSPKGGPVVKPPRI